MQTTSQQSCCRRRSTFFEILCRTTRWTLKRMTNVSHTSPFSSVSLSAFLPSNDVIPDDKNCGFLSCRNIAVCSDKNPSWCDCCILTFGLSLPSPSSVPRWNLLPRRRRRRQINILHARHTHTHTHTHTDMRKNTGASLRELSPVVRGSQDAGSRNLPLVFHVMSVHTSVYCPNIYGKVARSRQLVNMRLCSRNLPIIQFLGTTRNPAPASSFSLPINNPFVAAFSPSNETRYRRRESLEVERVRERVVYTAMFLPLLLRCVPSIHFHSPCIATSEALLSILPILSRAIHLTPPRTPATMVLPARRLKPRHLVKCDEEGSDGPKNIRDLSGIKSSVRFNS